MTATIINGAVAHVGFSNTAADRARTLTVLYWMMQNGYDFGHVDRDHIDLNKGRDFLAETKSYEAVVLHFLFRGGYTINSKGSGNSQLTYSEHSSWSVWRKRLVNSGARLIFAFGGPSEIGGSYIVNLDGYTAHRVEDEFWVFERR